MHDLLWKLADYLMPPVHQLQGQPVFLVWVLKFCLFYFLFSKKVCLSARHPRQGIAPCVRLQSAFSRSHNWITDTQTCLCEPFESFMHWNRVENACKQVYIKVCDATGNSQTSRGPVRPAVRKCWIPSNINCSTCVRKIWTSKIQVRWNYFFTDVLICRYKGNTTFGLMNIAVLFC